MRLADTVRVTEHDCGALILDIGLGKFYSVDPVGKLILGWLQENIDSGVLLKRLKHTFPEESEEHLSRDLNSFLEMLTRTSLLATLLSADAAPE